MLSINQLREAGIAGDFGADRLYVLESNEDGKGWKTEWINNHINVVGKDNRAQMMGLCRMLNEPGSKHPNIRYRVVT